MLVRLRTSSLVGKQLCKAWRYCLQFAPRRDASSPCSQWQFEAMETTGRLPDTCHPTVWHKGNGEGSHQKKLAVIQNDPWLIKGSSHTGAIFGLPSVRRIKRTPLHQFSVFCLRSSCFAIRQLDQIDIPRVSSTSLMIQPYWCWLRRHQDNRSVVIVIIPWLNVQHHCNKLIRGRTQNRNISTSILENGGIVAWTFNYISKGVITLRAHL